MYTFLLNMSLAFCAAISPGPNIILVTQNSLVFGRKNGILTALGVLAGVFFWLVFLAVGFVYLVQKPKVLFTFHLFASVYLFYIVYLIYKIKIDAKHSTKTASKAFFFESFVITMLNPEIAVFYGSILTGIFADNPHMAKSTIYIALYVTGFMVVEAAVFLSSAYFVSGIGQFMVKYISIVKVCASIAIIYFASKMIVNAYMGYQLLF